MVTLGLGKLSIFASIMELSFTPFFQSQFYAHKKTFKNQHCILAVSNAGKCPYININHQFKLSNVPWHLRPTSKKKKNFGKTPEKQFIFLHHYNWLQNHNFSWGRGENHRNLFKPFLRHLKFDLGPYWCC